MRPEKTPIFVYWLAIMAVMGGLLFGYDTGVVAGAMVILKDEWTTIDNQWQVFG